jgi:hypothetical protein
VVLTAGFAWVGGRRLEPDLLVHGAVYAVASAIAAGLPAIAVRAWLLGLDSWPLYPSAAWLVVAATAVALVGPRLAAGNAGGRLTAFARLVFATVLVVALGTWAVLAVGPAVVARLPAPAALAALRSLLIAGTAVALTYAGRLPRARALGQLVIPALVAGALKILLQDLWQSGPMLLFVTFAAYGLALMAGSRTRPR